MGGKSDFTKYVSEIPMFCAFVNQQDYLPEELTVDSIKSWLSGDRIFESSKVLAELDYSLPVALGDKESFRKNFEKARKFVHKMNNYCTSQNTDEPNKFYWQSTERDRKGVTTPSDIIFVGHSRIKGVSVKTGAPNQFNLGVGDFSFGISRGDDLIGALAPDDFWPLLRRVKEITMDIPIGSLWSKTRSNKYSIKRLSVDTFEISIDGVIYTCSRKELLENKEPKYIRRVFGDKYQSIKNKSEVKDLRVRLTKTLISKIPMLYTEELKTNSKLSFILGGFTDEEYFYSDFSTEELFLVPSIGTVTGCFNIECLPTTNIFGSGFKMKCKIKFSETRYATVESWLRYHTGTFSGPPQNMIQNLKGKENIWVKVL